MKSHQLLMGSAHSLVLVYSIIGHLENKMWLQSKYQMGRGDDDSQVNPLLTVQLEGRVAPSCPTDTQHAPPRFELLAQRWKKLRMMWYPTGGCSIHKPLFVRGPHRAQRAFCPQGRPTAGKQQRKTPGKRLVHYSPLKSSPATGFLKEEPGQGGGVD